MLRDDTPPNRVRCDPGTRSVTLDRKGLATALPHDTFSLFQFIATAEGPVSGPDIRAAVPTLGVRIDREIKNLPEELRALIRSGKGTGGGYWLILPPECT